MTSHLATEDLGPKVYFRAELTDLEYDELIELAIKDAESKAKRIATSVGKQLGKLDSVSHSRFEIMTQIHGTTMRLENFPILNDIDVEQPRTAINQNPRPAKFDVKVSSSYRWE